MGREVIIMGNKMGKRYEDNINDIARVKRFTDTVRDMYSEEVQRLMNKEPEIVETQYFKEYSEITKSDMISKNLNVGDHIYLEEDNKCYEINGVAENIYGDTIYFINKTVEIVWDEDKDEQKERAQKKINEYLKKNNITEELQIRGEYEENKLASKKKWWSIFK